MSLAIVIPTLPRKDTGFHYVMETLQANNAIFKNHAIIDKFIYCDDQHKNKFTDCFENGFSHMPKITHIENNHPPDGYEFWRLNLCLDFLYSLQKAASQTLATHVAWLEDDSILEPDFIDIFLKNKNANLLIAKIGATCVIIRKDYMKTFIRNIHENKYLDSTPLDWILEKFNPKLLPITRHIGQISSRTDSLIMRPCQ